MSKSSGAKAATPNEKRALIAYYSGAVGTLPGVTLKTLDSARWMQAVRTNDAKALKGYAHVYLFVGIRGMNNEQVEQSEGFCRRHKIPCGVISKALAARDGLTTMFPQNTAAPAPPDAKPQAAAPTYRYQPASLPIPVTAAKPHPLKVKANGVAGYPTVQKVRRHQPRVTHPPIAWPHSTLAKNSAALQAAASEIPAVPKQTVEFMGVTFLGAMHLARCVRKVVPSVNGPQLRAAVLAAGLGEEVAQAAHVAINFLDRPAKTAGKVVHENA